MQEIDLDDIKNKAYDLNKSGLKWHFHILTPTCNLNESDLYAFILECPEKNLSFVYYSDKAEKEVGQELSPLLHGAKIMDKDTTEEDYKPSEKIKEISERAKLLNSRGVEWHHHVLFPGCRFNKHSPKFVLIFEDSQSGDMFESLSDNEPTNDLKQIESLFYKK